MTRRCKKRLVKKYNTQSLHILRDHVRCAPAPRYNCPHLHFYFMLFCAPASHFTHPHLFHLSFPHPRSRRKVPNSAVWVRTLRAKLCNFKAVQNSSVKYQPWAKRVTLTFILSVATIIINIFKSIQSALDIRNDKDTCQQTL